MDWDFFFRQLDAGINVGEICFYFEDDPDEKEHFIGYQSQYEKPYWAGYCDIKDGCAFKTANELVDAPIYNGRTLRECWDKVVIYTIEACSQEEWMALFQHV